MAVRHLRRTCPTSIGTHISTAICWSFFSLFLASNWYDPVSVGFVSTVESDGGRTFFKYDTTLPGNGNGGHNYGTNLPEADKRALVEYMKKF